MSGQRRKLMRINEKFRPLRETGKSFDLDEGDFLFLIELAIAGLDAVKTGENK